MIADLEFAERPAVRGLHVAKVSDRVTATDFAAVLSEAFGFPQDICEAEFVDKAFWREEAYASVSYYHDKPASVSSVIIVDQILYVGLVATRPAFRNKGPSYETNYLLLEEAMAETGIRRAALHATDAGRPIYEKLGFRPVMTIAGFGF